MLSRKPEIPAFIFLGRFLFIAFIRIHDKNHTVINNPLKIDEQQLLAKLQSRDILAFNYIYDNYSRALYGVILRIVASETIAEEVLHDTFMKIWDRSAQYDPQKGRLYTWMVNIARNLAIDRTRSKEFSKGSKTDPMENIVYAYDARNFDEIVIDKIGVDSLVHALNDDQKQIVDMVYFKGYTQSQIAELTGIPLGTIKTRLKSGLAKLKNILGKEG